MIALKNLWGIGLIFLSGCVVGPTYKHPHHKMPKIYAEQSAQNRVVGDLAHWWMVFEDVQLNDLIKKAIAQNYDLKIAQEKIEETRFLYQIQKANLAPEINVVGDINATQNSCNLLANRNSTTDRIVSLFRGGFDALWEVDFWGKLRRARNAAYDEYQAQIWNMRDVYVILLGDVVNAYIDGCSFQKKVDILQQQIAVDTQLLTLSRDRFRAGIASDLPDLEQLAALDESKSQLTLLQINLKQTVYRLRVLLGENPEEFTVSLKRHEVPHSKKILNVGLPSELLKRRPDIRQAERLLAAATENIGVAKADYFPRFLLVGGTVLESNKGSNLFSGCSVGWSIGPSIQWPLISFGRIKFNVKAKESAQKQALLSYSKSIVQALGDVETALVAYLKQEQRRTILRDKLCAATRERDLTKSLWDSGLANQLDFLTLEKNRLNIEFELIDSEQTLSTNLIAVYKALGGGW